MLAGGEMGGFVKDGVGIDGGIDGEGIGLVDGGGIESSAINFQV